MTQAETVRAVADRAEAAERVQVFLTDELQAAEVAMAEARRKRDEAARALADTRAAADALQERLGVAQEATDSLRGELEEVRSKRGWKRVLLRLAVAVASRRQQGA